MAEPVEKSTEAVRERVHQRFGETVWLDSRLALYAEKGNWLAVSDLHFGYEISRRARGGLWPVWGADSLAERLGQLLRDYQPETLILNGDVIDSKAAARLVGEQWLASLAQKGGFKNLVLVRGNHDRGGVLRKFDWVNFFETGEFLFHHGHEPMPARRMEGKIELTGHLHPARRFSDGAGLAMKLPVLVQETSRWVLPAFSPWAGGVHLETGALDPETKLWACGPRRIFRIL